MKSSLVLVLTAVLAASPITAATTSCAKSNAIAWPKTTSTDCKGGPKCEELKRIGQCNSVKLTGGTCVTKKKKRAAEVDARAAVDLQCTASETCFLYTDGDLMCMNLKTGEYSDSQGGHGNALKGIYTLANGRVSTVIPLASLPTVTGQAQGAAATTTGVKAGVTSSATHSVGAANAKAASSTSALAGAGATPVQSATPETTTTKNAANPLGQRTGLGGVLGLVVAAFL